MLYATVRNRKIHVKKPDTVVQNGVKVDWLQLEMDDEWAEMDSIVCVFVARYTEEQTDAGGTKALVEQEITKEMLHTFGQKVLVPWECLEHSGMLSVSCTGYVGSEKIMTTMYPDSFWQIVQNGPKSGDSSIEPTPSLYDQIVAAAGTANASAMAANQAKDQLLQDKANGVFNGADGASAKVSVGSTQTGSEGSEAQVYSTGTDQDLELHFVIPRGRQGIQGETGPQGPIGAAGPKGDTGERGPQGPKGDPFTYSDFTQEQLASLKGDKGEKGDTGPSGADGKSAYQYAVDGGYTGTEDEFKEKLAAEIPVVDSTLTQSGQAADAAVVGQELSSLSGKIDAIPSGKDGITPTIGDNGNWYLGDTDTGKPSRGEPGQDGADGKDGAPGADGADGHTPVKGTDYFTAADKQEIAEAAAGMVSIPDKLPNPNALTFTGAVTGSYDGSEPLTVNIPSSAGGSGGSGGLPNWRLIKTLAFSSEIAYITFSEDDNGESFAVKEFMIVGTVPDLAGNGYLYCGTGISGSVNNSVWPAGGKEMRWWLASVGGALKTMLAVSGTAVTAPMDKNKSCPSDIVQIVIGASAGFTADGTLYVYGR